MTMRYTGWALTVQAYRTTDGELVRALLAGPHITSVLALDYRALVGATVIDALVERATRDEFHRVASLRHLHRLNVAGAVITALIPLLLNLLGTSATGRGLKRVDLGATALAMLRFARLGSVAMTFSTMGVPDFVNIVQWVARPYSSLTALTFT